MKATLSIILISTSLAFRQSVPDKIPSVTVKSLNGSSFNTQNIANNGKPILLCFWATWCRSSVKELDAIAELYPDWQKETGVKLVAISYDDARSVGKVNTMVKVKNWTYDVYLDINQDFKRAMNVNICPHTFLIDNKGGIVWQSSSYLQGSEDNIYELVKKLARNEEIERN